MSYTPAPHACTPTYTHLIELILHAAVLDVVVSHVLIHLADLIVYLRPHFLIVVWVHVYFMGVFGKRWEEVLQDVNVAAQKKKRTGDDLAKGLCNFFSTM